VFNVRDERGFYPAFFYSFVLDRRQFYSKLHARKQINSDDSLFVQKKGGRLMRKFYCVVMLFAVLLMTWFSPIAVSEEQDSLSNYADGTVVSVNPGTITISEYNFDLDLTKDMVYEIASDVEFENADSLEDIKEGCEVSIEYVAKDGKNQIMSIYLYEEEDV